MPFIRLKMERLDQARLEQVAEGLCELDWRVRERRVPPKFWQWLYFGNPAGDAVAMIAYHEGRPVGRFERIPLRMIVDGESVGAELLQGLTLDREFRQWTHYRRLVGGTLREERAEKPAFSFAFATAMFAGQHHSMGEPVLGRVPVFAAVLDGKAMLRHRRALPLVSAAAGALAQALFRWRPRPAAAMNIEIREIAEFPEETGSFQHAPALRGPALRGKVALRKDRAYLNWRYTQCPGVDYRRLAAWRGGQLCGFLVWRSDEIGGNGWILELSALDDDPGTLSALLGAARGEMQLAGAGLVMASFPEGGAAARALRRAGFAGLATRWKNLSLIIVPGPLDCPAVSDRTAWTHSMGDWLYH
jgi:hypothetical protein